MIKTSSRLEYMVARLSQFLGFGFIRRVIFVEELIDV